jgi:SAM-dependent methyltransferase
MLHSRHELQLIEVHVDGVRVGVAKRVPRADVARQMSWIPHAKNSGFECRLPACLFEEPTLHHIDLIGFASPTGVAQWLEGARRLFGHSEPAPVPVARYHTLFRSDIDVVLPSPPAHLMQRVVNSHDERAFRTGGLKVYADFLAALAPHRDVSSIRSLLDWGCGCGRATAHFMLHQPTIPEVRGCDIDAEAIAWCNANLAPGQFTSVAPLPPMPYADGQFDVVVSCSVLSHLKREMQHRWLAELHRILAPDGLVAASFHGLFAAAVLYPPKSVHAIRRLGISDDTPDGSLGGIVEEGYYNSTFQTREYTLREFSKHFQILDYLEAGMHNFQDLVVMKKTASR